jgi:hypothetical protein
MGQGGSTCTAPTVEEELAGVVEGHAGPVARRAGVRGGLTFAKQRVGGGCGRERRERGEGEERERVIGVR